MTSRPNLPPERAPRAALISPDPSFRSMVTSCLDEAAPMVEWVLRAETDVKDLQPESVERLAERDPELLFIDVGTSHSAGVRFVSAVTERIPTLTVVAAGGGLGVDELLELIRAGASGYFRRPWNREEVVHACSHVLRKMSVHPVGGGATFDTVSRVIALFAPKGGTGVSTLSANLALYIHRATSKRTLLVDFSPGLGTCSVLLGMQPRYSYFDVLESLHRMDERLLHSFLGEHDSGLRVLASPVDVQLDRGLTSESAASLLRLLRRYFEYVVVDTGRSNVDDAVLQVMDVADERLVVTTPELPTLRNVKQVLPHLVARHQSASPPHLIVNRYEDGSSFPVKDIERAVGLPPFQIIEEDRERVSRSVNLGRPIVVNGTSPYSRAVASLGDRLAAAHVTQPPERTSFGGLLRTVLPPFTRGNGRHLPAASAHRPPAGSRQDAPDPAIRAANGRGDAANREHDSVTPKPGSAGRSRGGDLR